MEGDSVLCIGHSHNQISIHTLRMEGDSTVWRRCLRSSLFQSTPSAWRVTRPPSSGKRRDKFQSTPSAWRVTRATYLLPETSPQFQSTPSAWRVTSGGSRLGRNQQISIHTLRMEGDNFINNIIAHIKGFQSTPSAWRVTKVGQWVAQTKGFQSTPSAWRVTLPKI